MKPVVCYAVAAMPLAAPGRAAIADLLAIGSGGYFSKRSPEEAKRIPGTSPLSLRNPHNLVRTSTRLRQLTMYTCNPGMAQGQWLA